MRYKEQKGHLPFMRAKAQGADSNSDVASSRSGVVETTIEKKASEEGTATVVREIEG